MRNCHNLDSNRARSAPEGINTTIYTAPFRRPSPLNAHPFASDLRVSERGPQRKPSRGLDSVARKIYRKRLIDGVSATRYAYHTTKRHLETNRKVAFVYIYIYITLIHMVWAEGPKKIGTMLLLWKTKRADHQNMASASCNLHKI